MATYKFIPVVVFALACTGDTATEEPSSITTARDDLLSQNVLSDKQRQFLDSLGNQNGVFDVGDFLALVDRCSILGADRVNLR